MERLLMFNGNILVVGKTKIKTIVKYSYWTVVHIFAVIGVIFVGVYFAVNFKVTNVEGQVDSINQEFAENAQVLETPTPIVVVASESGKKAADVAAINNQISQLNVQKEKQINILCNLEELSYIAPKNVGIVLNVRKKTSSDYVSQQMIFAIKTHLDNLDQLNADVTACSQSFDPTKINEEVIANRVANSNSKNIFEWPDKEEWLSAEASIAKDKDKIDRAAGVAGVEPRIIVSNLMVEQLRLFYSQRELYKKYFQPLEILANAYKISLGVMGIKEETAQNIEAHLKDLGSPYYLGPADEHLLDYSDGADVASERYNRLSGNDHYWNYLYGALYLKQMMTQWTKAGFDISARPEIVGTLFNVGFPQSKPNANPKVGGSTVKIDQTDYSFGRLSYEFYYSGEMFADFPYISHL